MGWLFAAIATLFSLGLTPRFGRSFYPTSPSFGLRLAAPALFLLIATACFWGYAIQAFVVTVALGLPLIVTRRWNDRRNKPQGTA